jgi:hypothetical protein
MIKSRQAPLLRKLGAGFEPIPSEPGESSEIGLTCGLAPRQGLADVAQGPVVPAWPLCATVMATLTSEAAISTAQKMIAM